MATCARCYVGRIIDRYGIDNVREIRTPPSRPDGWETYDIYLKSNPVDDEKWYTLTNDESPWMRIITVYSMGHSLDEDCDATTHIHMYPDQPDAYTYGYPEHLEPGAFTEHLPAHHIKAWATLTERLANTLLPDDTRKMIRCTPDDFTLSHTDKEDIVWFTNKISRNYLGIKPDGKLRIPTTSKLFYRGYFLSATTTK